MRVLVTGASGTLGTKLTSRLIERGHEVIGISRSPRRDHSADPDDDQAGTVTWRVGDISTGEGVQQAVADVDVVVHLASDPRSRTRARATDIEGTTRLAAFGIPVVYMSIVGVDRSPFSYYRTKLAGEQALISSSAPWTIVRATQFHEFFDQLLATSRDAGAKLPTRTPSNAPLVFPGDWQVGPVAAVEVASYLVDLVEQGSTRSIHQIGGPESMSSRSLSQQWARVRGGRYFSLPTIGRIAGSFKAGVTVPDDPEIKGTMTWREYLESSVVE